MLIISSIALLALSFENFMLGNIFPQYKKELKTIGFICGWIVSLNISSIIINNFY